MSKLKAYLVEHCGLKADATELEVKGAIGDAIIGGKLTTEKLAELTKADSSEMDQKVTKIVDEAMGKHFASLNDTLAKLVGAKGSDGADAGAKAMNAGIATQANGGSKPDDVQVRVKSIAESFDRTRSNATWDKSTSAYTKAHMGGKSCDTYVDGLPYAMEMPSKLDKAIIGAWFRRAARQANKSWTNTPVSELDRKLIEYAVHECKFTGDFAGKEYTGEENLSELHRKALLDDSTSGGLEIVPIEFDSALILQPLLNGELFPYVDVKQVSRRRIEAGIVNNPTLIWGTGEGTAISLFDTDSFITAFDNSIYPVTGAMEMGEDFLSDSPTNIGDVIVKQYGEQFKQELDTVIANGNGTSQPEGVFNKSGTSVITPAGGAGTDPQVGDYEGMIFGIGKQYLDEAGRGAGSRACFIGTQTSYSRARGIPVGSSDARRIFGMDEQSYSLFGFRYAINSSAGNAKIAFACLNRYRMYRRSGFEMTFVGNTDWQLARENKKGLVVRARFGGALELSAAATKQTAAKS